MKQQSLLVVVTGGGGYVGSILVPLLLTQGYHVRVIDRFFFGKSTLKKHANLELFEADTRNFSKKLLAHAHAVIDLAALADEATCCQHPALTRSINVVARIRTAKLAKSMHVTRYIQASSCSVYTGQIGPCDETHAVNPQSLYSTSCVQAENGALAFHDKTFCVTVLRLGSLYGLAPRMRWDLPVNKMVLSAAQKGTITLVNGTQWRAIVHVTDAARAVVGCLQAKKTRIAGQIINVASENIQITNLAEHIALTIPTKTNRIEKLSDDYRSWRASTQKYATTIGTPPRVTLEKGVREIYDALTTKRIRDTKQTHAAHWYKTLAKNNPTLGFPKK